MPPAHVVTTVEDRAYPRRRSERRAANRAASVPVDQQENSRLRYSLPMKQKPLPLDVEDVPSSSLPSVVIARGRKRDLSRVASQPDCVADASGSVTEDILDANEQRPRKRRKRSSSTPAAPRSSHLSTRLQSRRLSRSRAGSPTADVGRIGSARLSRKIQSSFIDSRSSDIYTHLADPDDARNLPSGLPVRPVMLSIPNEMVGPRSVWRSRGRQRKISDLTDGDAKKDLMEEWARLRQFQGPLPLSGMSASARFTQALLHGNQEDRSVSSMQLEATTRRASSDVVKGQTTATVGISHSREIELDVSPLDFDTLPMGTSVSRTKSNHKNSMIPPDSRAELSMVPSLDTAAPSTSIPESQVEKGSSDDKLAGVPEIVPHVDLLQCPESSPSSLSSRRSREDSARIKHTLSRKLPLNEQPEAGDLNKGSCSAAFPQAYPLDTGDIYLDSDAEFYMLDIPDIFTLPWVPVPSHHLYVPPSLGKLVSGMREQLAMEARARRKAEELYWTEMTRRICAEKVIEDLRTQLEEKQKNPSRQRDCH